MAGGVSCWCRLTNKNLQLAPTGTQSGANSSGYRGCVLSNSSAVCCSVFLLSELRHRNTSNLVQQHKRAALHKDVSEPLSKEEQGARRKKCKLRQELLRKRNPTKCLKEDLSLCCRCFFKPKPDEAPSALRWCDSQKHQRPDV